MATQVRSPISDDAVSGTWTGTAGSRWSVVDDYPTTTGDYLDHGTTAGNLTFGFSAFSIPANSTGISVQVLYYDAEPTSGNNNFGGRLKVGGSYYNATTHNPSGTSFTARSDNWANNPKTSAAWTVADINGTGTNPLQAFGYYSSDANPAIRTPCIQLQVTYTPPADHWLRVSHAELEAPGGPRRFRLSHSELEAPVSPRLCRISHSELEAPNAPRRALISWSETELPTAPRRYRLSWAELETPVFSPNHTVRIAWAELETPTPPRKGRISYGELEIPAAPRRFRVAWSELEVPVSPRRCRVSFAEAEAPIAIRALRLAWSEIQVNTAPRFFRLSWVVLELAGSSAKKLMKLGLVLFPKRMQPGLWGHIRR